MYCKQLNNYLSNIYPQKDGLSKSLHPSNLQKSFIQIFGQIKASLPLPCAESWRSFGSNKFKAKIIESLEQ